MIKACIFDLDGVIVDTAHYHFIAWKRLADQLGIPFNEQDNERLKGVSRIQSMDIILELGGRTMSLKEKEKLANTKNIWFVEFVEKMKPEEIFPGVRTLIKELKDAGIKVALASSSKNAKRVIQLLEIENDFDAVVDGTMIEHTKPDPEIFLLASKIINVLPKDCVVVEDAEAGVEAALAAGMKCIGVGRVDQLGKANRVVKLTAEINISELRIL